jgi:hypothetical protein
MIRLLPAPTLSAGLADGQSQTIACARLQRGGVDRGGYVRRRDRVAQSMGGGGDERCAFHLSMPAPQR